MTGIMSQSWSPKSYAKIGCSLDAQLRRIICTGRQRASHVSGQANTKSDWIARGVWDCPNDYLYYTFEPLYTSPLYICIIIAARSAYM
jgi:hypothetical protein